MLDKPKLTLLSAKELTNYDKKLKVLDKYGIIAPITDLAMLTGSYYNRQDDLKILDCALGPYRSRAGWFWLKASSDGNATILLQDGMIGKSYCDRRTRTIRPVLKVSKRVMADLIKYAELDDVKTILLGEYPQYVPDETTQKILDELKALNLLNKTGRQYTFDGTDNYDFDRPFKPLTYEEYMYCGRKFIKIKSNLDKLEQQFTFANGQQCFPNQYYWVEVLPVKWLIDEKTNKLIAKEGLVGGIQFSHHKEYQGDFQSSDVYDYMNKYMVHDLFQSMNLCFDYPDYRNNLKAQNHLKASYNTSHVKIKTRK